MANWATLRPFILQQIVGIYSSSTHLYDLDDIDAWIPFSQLNQVCQHWRAVIKRGAATSAILLCSIPTADQLLRYDSIADFNELASRGIYLSASSSRLTLWRTNIPHIVQSKCSPATIELVISSRGCSIDFPSLGAVLEQFGFSSVKWYSLSRLFFLGNLLATGVNSDTMAPIPDDTRAKLLNTSQYFIKHIPSVAHLWYMQTYDLLRNFTAFPSAELLDVYLPRLQTLSMYASAFPALAHKHFPHYLTQLHLTITSKSAEHLPKIFAPSLVILWLTYTDTAHYWDIFRGSLPGSVVFENLSFLRIIHRNRYYALAEDTDAYLSRVSFPKLKELELARHPFTDPSALAIFKNTPLQNVTIESTIDRYEPLAVFAFRDVPSLCINIPMQADRADDQLYNAIAKELFRKPFSTHAAEIIFHTSLPLPLPDTILWTRLEKLYMQFRVYLSDLTTILPQLPLLRWLLVGAIYCTESDSADHNRTPIWSSTITKLVLFSSLFDYPKVPPFDPVCTLVSGLPSLLKLAVPDYMISTADRVFSGHMNNRRPGEANFELVGFSPKALRYYMQSGIPYTTGSIS